MNSSKVIRFIFVFILLGAFAFFEYEENYKKSYSISDDVIYQSNNIPSYSGEDVIILNNNEPEFDIRFDINESFEVYGELDNLGRCTTAVSNIGYDLMPTEPRGSIRDIRPSGFKIAKYSIIIDGLYLFNRCHLIGYQLTGENDNEKNLITCTRHMNADVMEPYESRVASYIRKTHNHVLYRVTPIFDNDNLVSKGVQMEALSLEDNGEGIKFNIFIYNVQPGIEIDYKTGDSKQKD